MVTSPSRHQRLAVIAPGPELELAARFLSGGSVAASAIPWETLRPEDLLTLREWARESLAAPGGRRLLRSLRRRVRGARAALGEEQIAERCFRPYGGRAREAAGLGPRPVKLLLAACEDGSARGRRDRMLLCLLLHAGLTPREIVSLQVSDFEPEHRTIRVRGGGRGRASRLLLLSDECLASSLAWLERRGRASGPLLAVIDSRDVPRQNRGLSAAGLRRALRQRARQAGCEQARSRDLATTFRADLRREARLDPMAPRLLFGLGEDGEPLIMVRTLMPR